MKNISTSKLTDSKTDSWMLLHPGSIKDNGIIVKETQGTMARVVIIKLSMISFVHFQNVSIS